MNWLRRIFVLILILISFSTYGKDKLKSLGFNYDLITYVELDSPKVDLPFPSTDQNGPSLNNNDHFNLNLPSNIETQIKYNPKTGMYDIYQKIGDKFYRYPTSMTREQYLDYLNQKAINDRIFDLNQDENQSNKDLIPALKVGGPGFDNIFGGDQISIRPQGSAELRFGVNVSLYKNPAIPIKNQRVTTFDFQQNIQLNLVGQIGDKLKIEIAQNTQATFNFKNQVKIAFTGYEDDIIQKIEAGNVSLPLNTTLIQGSQSLFGIRTDLKFGHLTIQSILSQQKGKRQEINVAGGAQIQDFEVEAANYEANKHYFLNFYHRNHYDEAMSTMPYVSSGVSITKIEVWVTNKVNKVENTRNIIGFTDLGETKTEYLENPLAVSINTPAQEFPDNSANSLYEEVSTNPLIREFSNAVNALSPNYTQSKDFEKVENARQLSEQEYTYNALLGYISLRQPLNQDQVLAVAYQYTYQGRTYQVGEFSNDVPVEQGSKTALVLKLLKATVLNPQNTLWDLMMKNVYSIGAYNVGQQDFKLDVWYNNPKTSVDVNYLPYTGVDDKILIQYLDLDRLNLNTESYPDGRFDFVPLITEGNRTTNGGTIDTKTGRIYFTTIEPFGNTLKDKLVNLSSPPMAPTQAEKLAFEELYDSTKTAAQQIPSKNRFRIKGSYMSSVSSDISLNALNIPEGSVTVTAGGVKLTEGVDYTVDYNLGRVKILNQGILEAQTPIKVQLESNSVFGFNSKSLVGAHFNYEFNKDFNWGATVMNLTEKPLTQKVNVGNEPISNTVLGTDVNFRHEAPILTKLVDFLPVISTKEKSYITAGGEFAYLIPGTQRAIGQGGISYIDAFEGSQSAINIANFGSWKLASIPQGQPTLFPEATIKGPDAGNGAGFDRSLLAWYVVDPSAFYLGYSTTPEHIKGNDTILNDSRMRMVSKQELFPQSQPPVGTLNNIPIFDLAYYPKERGPYNYDTTTTNIDANGLFTNPEDRWAGIMRSLTTTNFEQANVQYIQFWLLDPYNSDATDESTINLDDGYLYFNLGNISEDILPDSRKSFENGNPTSASLGTTDYDETDWAMISNQQVIVYAFDNNAETRIFQDIGFDGLGDDNEISYFNSYVNWVNSSPLTPDAKAKLLADVSSDNFKYYLSDEHDLAKDDILERYKYFNGTERNSLTPELTGTSYPAQSTTVPDVEDLNQDNNLSESENYFQYKVPISPNGFTVGQNFIKNKQTIDLGNGKTETWYQFKIPISKYDQVVNGISDFRSIRFMRMFVTGFENEKILRFANLELIRGTWREYTHNLNIGEQEITDPNATTFEISAVNLEENQSKTPVNYAIPPGIARQNDYNSINQRQLNEQSLSLTVCGLKDGDSRATYKNLALDVRSYGKIEMFVHAEAKDDETQLKDNDLTVFVRIGTDFENNYYEYELPLKLTPWGTTFAQDDVIWPTENNVVINLDSLVKLKAERDLQAAVGGVSTLDEYSWVLSGNKRITVKGNPTLSNAKLIMVGVRNPDKGSNTLWLPDDGEDKCAEVWVNELRLTDFKTNDGWASTAKVNMQLADFGNVSVAGNYSTPGWGSIEKKVSERQREYQKGFDVTSNFEMGQFFGRKISIQLPMYVGYSANVIDPQYDLAAPDVKLKEYDPTIRKTKLLNSRTITTRRSINFTNVRKERTSGKPVHFWDLENFSLTYSYNELYRRDFNTEMDITKTYRGGLNYSFSAKPKLLEPFKKVSFIKKSKWLRLVRDFNFYLGPKAFTFNNDLQRMNNVRQNRNALDTNFIFLPTYYKTFTWNRTYNFKYDISKGLKFNFNANNQGIVLEPQGLIDPDAPQGTTGYNNSVLYNDVLRKTFNPFVNHDDSIRFGGFTKNYQHNFDVSYKVPFNKFPLTSWMSANIKYRGSYDWNRAPLSQPLFGNTIQNSRNFTVNGKLNLVTLYNKVDYLKRINNGGKAGRGKPKKPASRMGGKKEKGKGKEDDKKEEKKKKDKEKKDINPIIVGIGQAIMSVRNVSFNYTITDGILMPGFNGQSQLIGMDNATNGAPSFGFVSGGQNYDLFGNPVDTWGSDSAFAPFAASHNWLVKNPDLNIQHTVSHTKNYSFKTSIQPFKDLSINLSASRKYSENQNSYYRWSEDPFSPGDSLFQYQNPMNVGNLNFTTITWGTAFTKLDSAGGEKTFVQMLENRKSVSKQLGDIEGTDTGSNGYADGFGENQQDVLIGSFLTAYTGKKNDYNPFSMMPLPNWDIRYNGLAKYKFMKKYVRNFTIKHGYRSTVSISNFQTNLSARDNSNTHLRDDSYNFIADQQIKSITIAEQFSPLFGIDATWIIKKNGLITKFEYKKNRSLSLNIANYQITEMRGQEWVFGTGYKFSQLKMPFKFMGKTPKSDLNIRFDLSIRNNITVSRNIIENTAQKTSGQNMYSIKSSVDYNLGPNLNVSVYFDRTVNNPVISTAYKTANTRAGIALRFNLAG